MPDKFCHLCEAKIFNFHSKLQCMGFCDKKIHSNCFKKYNDSTIYEKGIILKIEDEKMQFVCIQCNDINTLTGDHNHPDEENNEELQINNSEKYILEILKTVKSLSNELIYIRAENRELKNEIVSMKKLLLLENKKQLPAEGRTNNTIDAKLKLGAKTYAGIARSNKSNNSPLANPSSENVVQPTTSYSTNDSALSKPSHSESVSDADKISEENTDQEGFKLVTHKKKKNKFTQALQGCMKSTALKPAKKIKKKELFISRLDPSTTTIEIESFLLNNLKIKNAKCTKLKTKYLTYSSFHLSINADDYVKVHHEDVWPEGILIKNFVGKLIDHNSKNDHHQEDQRSDT